MNIKTNIYKKYSSCGKVLLVESFRKDRTHKDNLRSRCRFCDQRKEKEYRKSFKNKKKKREYDFQYYRKNKEKIIKRKVKKYNDDEITKIKHNLRCRLRDALKKEYKSGSFVRDLGCSIPKLIKYLESKFKEGMNWKNYGSKGWHIDHIKPLSSFDLTDRKQFLEACHYTNLQPLW